MRSSMARFISAQAGTKRSLIRHFCPVIPLSPVCVHRKDLDPFTPSDLLLPQHGFCPEGEIPTRLPRVIEKYLQLKYAVSKPEKISNCSIRGRMESLGSDDVSIVHARKYEMVRMT